MKKLTALLLALTMVFTAVCAAAEAQPENETVKEAENMLTMRIGETPVQVQWEDNEAVAALRELAKDGLTVQMSMYGGFEQVGWLGAELPSSDVQTDTASGDIVLYSGDQLVVFYGHNAWAYTRLGRITDQSEEAMRELLSHGDVTITIALEQPAAEGE